MVEGPATAVGAGTAFNTGTYPETVTRTFRDYDQIPAYPNPPVPDYHPMCSPNAHNFSCRHEVYCTCGRTQRRMEIQVDEGL